MMPRASKRRRPSPSFCPQCMQVRDNASPRECCAECRIPLQRVIDDAGALTREYLLARRKCCENFCRNCPWEHPARLASAEHLSSRTP